MEKFTIDIQGEKALNTLDKMLGSTKKKQRQCPVCGSTNLIENDFAPAAFWSPKLAMELPIKHIDLECVDCGIIMQHYKGE